MEFITGICPKCDGSLQLPSDREKVICMYCGAEIEIKQAVRSAKERPELTEKDREAYGACEKKALELFPGMLFSMDDPLKNFKKNAYEGKFRVYEKKCQNAMEAVEDAYMLCGNPQELFHDLAKELLIKVNQMMEGQKNKRHQEDLLFNYNMGLVIYLNPALIEFNKKWGEPLVEELLGQWKENFPTSNLKASNFESINGGFKRRYCYITTAVCESLGKGDDCYELTVLRNYRDGYLRRQDEGEELVKRYYDVAPTIVKRINKNPKREKIYENIWKDYLSPCIRMIEEDKNQLCMGLYTRMVEDLSDRYFNREERV